MNSKSVYETSLDKLLLHFNIFQKRALAYMDDHPEQTELRDQLLVWVHPRGLTNIVRTLSLHHQTHLLYPEVTEQMKSLNSEPIETSTKRPQM